MYHTGERQQQEGEERRRFLDRAVGDFRTAAAAFPENRIIRMYLGEPIPSDTTYPSVSGAPAWAELQRENLERLADIVVWWIDNRLQENGEYGGGWDDDCEIWRLGARLEIVARQLVGRRIAPALAGRLRQRLRPSEEKRQRG